MFFIALALTISTQVTQQSALDTAAAFIKDIEALANDDVDRSISQDRKRMTVYQEPNSAWFDIQYPLGKVRIDKDSGLLRAYNWTPPFGFAPKPVGDPLTRSEVLDRVNAYALLAGINEPLRVFEVRQSDQWEETALEISFVKTHQGVLYDRSSSGHMDIDWRSGRLLWFHAPDIVLPPADLAPRVTAEAARSTGLAGVFQIHKPSIVSEVIPHHLAIWQPNEPETSRRRRSFFSPEQAAKGRKGEGILAYVAQYANLDTYSERIGTYAWQYRAYVDAMTGRLLQMDFWFPMGGAPDDDEEPSPFGWDLAPTRAKVGEKAVEGAAVAFVKHAKAGPKGGKQVVLSHGGLMVQAVYDAQRNLLATKSRGVWAYGRPNERLKAALSGRN